MLIITFHNDGTGDHVIGNYDYSVYINDQRIYEGRLEGHEIMFGWKGLIQYFARQLKGE